jgi:hypothetical protein
MQNVGRANDCSNVPVVLLHVFFPHLALLVFVVSQLVRKYLYHGTLASSVYCRRLENTVLYQYKYLHRCMYAAYEILGPMGESKEPRMTLVLTET